MNRLQFKGQLLGALGRGYCVADEERATDDVLRLVVLRRGAAHVLVVETIEAWLWSLGIPPSPADRVLIKHLAIYIRRFFARPEQLPDRAFAWPGTEQSRGAIRQALDPRKSRRLAGRAQEG